MFRGTNRWVLAGIVALLVLNVILIALLLRPVEPPVSTDPLPSFTPVEITPGAVAGAIDPLPEPEPTPTLEPVTPVPVQRLLAAANDQIAWRATVGSCDQPATMERTQDGGATWQRVDPGIAPAIRLKATGPTRVFAIGGNPAAACAPTFAFSSTSGDTWVNADSELPGAWYLAPADRSTVHGPAAEVPVPCAGAVELAGLDSRRAAVLCVDGDIWLTGDGGATWAQAGLVEDAITVAPTSDGYLLALLRPSTCVGVGVTPISADGAGVAEASSPGAVPLGCAPITGAAPGGVALSSVGSNVWMWGSDGAVAISRDGGLTW